MGNSMMLLPEPDTELIYDEGTISNAEYSAATMQGWRRNQEDRYVCIPDFYNGFSFFGVYDGHGGSEIAEFLKRRLHDDISDAINSEDDIELALELGFLTCDDSIADPQIQEELNDLIEYEGIQGNASRIILSHANEGDSPSECDQSNVAGPSRETKDPKDSSEASVETSVLSDVAGPSKTSGGSKSDSDVKMDVERPLQYLLHEEIAESDPDDEDYKIDDDEESSVSESEDEDTCTAEDFLTQQPGFMSGSTATVAILDKSKIHVANVGDSRCVLSRHGEAVELSIDHKPEDPPERNRILAAGRTISEDGRIERQLDLSRAFGDFQFKRSPELSPAEQCVTADPDITSIDIVDDDEFLVIASDGIWNSMESQEVVDFISSRFQEDPNVELTDICGEIFNLVIAPEQSPDGHGCDNMTCIIIKFNTKKKSSQKKKSKLSSSESTDEQDD